MDQQNRPKRAGFLPRAILAFLFLGILLLGIYAAVYRGYPAVGKWDPYSDHDAFTYDGATWRCVGVIGKNGLTLSKYPIGDCVGRLADDGRLAGDDHGETSAPTLSPNAEPGETARPIRPDGDPTLERDHAYVLYSVKEKDNMLLLLDTDGEYYLYYPDVAEWIATADHSAFTYGKHTYLRLAKIGSAGFYSRDYEEEILLGLVHNDGLPAMTEPTTETETEPETDSVMPDLSGDTPVLVGLREHDYAIYTVKSHPYLLLVKESDGSEWLYYRSDSERPVA